MGRPPTPVCLNSDAVFDSVRTVPSKPMVSAESGVVVSFPIANALDALDAIQLSRPDRFDNGVIALLLDGDRLPMAALAIDGAPSDDLGPVGDLLRNAAAGAPVVRAVILGIVRPASSDVGTRGHENGQRRLWLDTAELVSWFALSEQLAEVDVTLTEVVVVEPDGWFALSEGQVPDSSGSDDEELS